MHARHDFIPVGHIYAPEKLLKPSAFMLSGIPLKKPKPRHSIHIHLHIRMHNNPTSPTSDMPETVLSVLCSEPWRWDSFASSEITFNQDGTGKVIPIVHPPHLL